MPAPIDVTNEMKQIVIDGLQNKIAIATLAKQIDVSPSTFRRLFKKEMAEHGSGNTKHRRTHKTISIVKGLVGLNAQKGYIAKCLGISVPTLNEHYQHELLNSKAAARAGVFNSLVKLATQEKPSLKAIELFLKCEEGWIEEEKRVQKSTTGNAKKGKKEQQKDNAREVAENGIYSVPPVPPGLKVVGGREQ